MKLLLALFAALGLASAPDGFENVSVNEFSAIIEKGGVQILDVRTPEEYAEGHIAGAVLVDYKDPAFEKNAVKVLKKKVPVAVYCRSGRRSAAAAQILTKVGYKVYNLETGIIGWTEAGKPVTK